jgi:ectoine hydroxylase-related dioxygenase (phytanoyl-CoA dioxygenase family)
MNTALMDSPTTTPVISEEELAFFHSEGYLVVPDIFADHDLQPVIDEITSQLDDLARAAVKAGTLSRTYEEFDFDHRLAMINRETPEIAKAMWNTNVVLPSFFDLMRTPRLLDAVERLCGPEIIASSVYRLRPKVPSHTQSAVPWHQDSGYFEPYCDKGLVLTVWLPLVDATREKGCMWVLPRQHKTKVFKHRAAAGQPYLEIPPEALPAGDAVCCPVPKGGALLMTNLTPHASFENNTDMVRWSMDLRYQSAALPTNAKITRLPGEVVGTPEPTGSDDAPVACFPPEPDFLVRSRLRPTEVMSNQQDFLRLRREHVTRPVTDRWNEDWKMGMKV